MSEKIENSLYKEQKNVKPTPEDVAGDFLNAERTADMLSLVEFIRANKLGIQWNSANSWSLSYKGKRLGFLMIYYLDIQEQKKGYECLFGESHPLHGSWFFCHRRDYLEHYYNMEDCDFKSFIFDHIYARNCGYCFCSFHIKGLKNLNEQKAGYMNPTGCGCWPLRIYNPTGEALDNTKRLIEYRMNLILEETGRVPTI